jgi:hypothetical protein
LSSWSVAVSGSSQSVTLLALAARPPVPDAAMLLRTTRFVEVSAFFCRVLPTSKCPKSRCGCPAMKLADLILGLRRAGRPSCGPASHLLATRHATLGAADRRAAERFHSTGKLSSRRLSLFYRYFAKVARKKCQYFGRQRSEKPVPNFQGRPYQM